MRRRSPIREDDEAYEVEIVAYECPICHIAVQLYDKKRLICPEMCPYCTNIHLLPVTRKSFREDFEVVSDVIEEAK